MEPDDDATSEREVAKPNRERRSVMLSPDRPLEGVRVVDFTHILAGPFGSQFLADAGADVIKVEPPFGEHARVRGPRRVGEDGVEVSAFLAACNRGKRSIALDLKNPHGLTTALRLVESADVLVENFTPGALARLGVDFAKCRADNPRLVTASISLFGGLESAGALATRGGLAIVAEAESSFTGSIRDDTGRPISIGMPLGDLATGMNAYAAIVTALFGRERTGEGRHLDISMVRTLFSINSTSVVSAQIAQEDGVNTRPAGYGIFPSKDGYVTIGVNSDLFFQRLTIAMGRPDISEDPRYAHYKDRDPRAAEVEKDVIAWTTSLTSVEIVEQLSEVGVPVGRITTPLEMIADDELRRLGFLRTVDDGIGGTLETPANPMGFSLDHYSLPRLGEHARAILAEVGISDDEVEVLAAGGAFGSVSVA